MNLIDSSGWIEFFLAGPNGPLFKPVIEQRHTLLVPVIALFEVYRVLGRKLPPRDGHQVSGCDAHGPRTGDH